MNAVCGSGFMLLVNALVTKRLSELLTKGPPEILRRLFAVFGGKGLRFLFISSFALCCTGNCKFFAEATIDCHLTARL